MLHSPTYSSYPQTNRTVLYSYSSTERRVYPGYVIQHISLENALKMI